MTTDKTLSDALDRVERAHSRARSADQEVLAAVVGARLAVRDHRCPAPESASEPVIVTGAQARLYPNGSQIIRVSPSDDAKVANSATVIVVGPEGWRIGDGVRYRVLYRAPEPEPQVRTFHVGDHLHNDQDVTDVPLGTVVRLLGDVTYARKTNLSGPWAGFGGVVMTSFVVGAEIIDLPD